MARTKSQAQIASEELEVLHLINRGMTTRQIKDHLEVVGRPLSQATVVRRSQSALENYVIPEIDAEKRKTLAQLDEVLLVQGPAFQAGDSKAAAIYLKTLALRARITGLEKSDASTSGQAPVQVNIQVLIEAERQRMLAERSAPAIATGLPPTPAHLVDIQDAEIIEEPLPLSVDR